MPNLNAKRANKKGLTLVKWGIIFLFISILCVFAAALSRRLEGRATAPSARRYVVVISIDGMRPDSYTHPHAGEHIPNLLRLKREGSFAEGVEGVYPTLTYPSHTTLVTGCTPAQDGIYTNLSSRTA